MPPPAITPPPRIKRISLKYTTQIPQSAHQSRGGRDTNLSMSLAEDFSRPCHRHRHRGAQSKSYDQEAPVARPGGFGPGVGGGEETGDDYEAGSDEEERALGGVAVREGRDQED